MRVLLTGGSSFTGYWFARELSCRGHEVAIAFRQPAEAYQGVRRERVELAGRCGEAVHGCDFGDERFMALIQDVDRWDVLCHHAADVTDYKSEHFNIAGAVANNTYNLKRVLEALAERGCRRLVLTGSVFEPGEGAGSEGLPAFSAYGLSKALTAQVAAYYADTVGMRMGKFVIPNPFGPYEEPRFTHHLMRTWFNGEAAQVRTPLYVRDNIHVSLLARAYGRFVEAFDEDKLNPSGYIESQGAFAERFAGAMRHRLGLECELAKARQSEFSEPRIRINTDPLDAEALAWDEVGAWDEIAAYYRGLLAAGSPAR